jgi:hypothetical protein
MRGFFGFAEPIPLFRHNDVNFLRSLHISIEGEDEEDDPEEENEARSG